MIEMLKLFAIKGFALGISRVLYKVILVIF